MQAVIMAGGKGSRLSEITKNAIPKPMVDIKGKPLLFWQLEQLKRYGIRRVTMIIGHLGEKIQEYFKDGKDFGCEIDYIVEEEPLGTAGAFYYLKDKLEGDDFLLLFGDVFFDIYIPGMERFHREKAALASLFVHPNGHPYDSDLIETDEHGRVIRFDSKHNVRDYWYDNMVNAGFYILHASVCDRVTKPCKTDLEKDILAEMARKGEGIYAYVSPEYIKDVGTVDRIQKMLTELDSGLIARKNLEYRQPAVFLDRDGTVNRLKGFIFGEEEFELEDGALEGIRLLNEAGILAIILTNQPSVARGLCSCADIEHIHKKMKTLLGREGVFVDGIYYCPHHPDKGFPEENPAYKIDCDCRKPKIGMLKEAVQRFHIDLEDAWMVGDSCLDMEMARRAGIKKALVRTGLGGKDEKYPLDPDLTADNLKEAVEMILKRREQDKSRG